MDRKRVLKLLSFAALAAGLAAVLPVAQRWPKDQTVHYVLGDGAARVTELDARWAEAREAQRGGDHGPGPDEWAREATFRYDIGKAPRVVTHAPRLPDGEYTVEIDLASAQARSSVTRNVTLAGGSTSIDLSHVLSDPGQAGAR